MVWFICSDRLFTAEERDLFLSAGRHPDALRREETHGTGRQDRQARRRRRNLNRPARPVRQEVPRVRGENCRRVDRSLAAVICGVRASFCAFGRRWAIRAELGDILLPFCSSARTEFDPVTLFDAASRKLHGVATFFGTSENTEKTGCLKTAAEKVVWRVVFSRQRWCDYFVSVIVAQKICCERLRKFFFLISSTLFAMKVSEVVDGDYGIHMSASLCPVIRGHNYLFC